MPQTDWANLGKSGDARRRAGEPANVREAREAEEQFAAKAVEEALVAQAAARETAKADRFAYLNEGGSDA